MENLTLLIVVALVGLYIVNRLDLFDNGEKYAKATLRKAVIKQEASLKKTEVSVGRKNAELAESLVDNPILSTKALGSVVNQASNIYSQQIVADIQSRLKSTTTGSNTPPM
jgi:hypothetical protein